ncbi:MAG: hypothetical protein JRC89_00830 [Deltaproteobacteria bacterium]|nr:hypothetical protein [Deltaproteobacteria bacterium]
MKIDDLRKEAFVPLQIANILAITKCEANSFLPSDNQFGSKELFIKTLLELFGKQEEILGL